MANTSQTLRNTDQCYVCNTCREADNRYFSATCQLENVKHMMRAGGALSSKSISILEPVPTYCTGIVERIEIKFKMGVNCPLTKLLHHCLSLDVAMWMPRGNCKLLI